MEKLFEPVQEKHDGKGRIVFVCKDNAGFYVLKPATGFRSKHWATVSDEELQASFSRQICCTHNNAFVLDNERPAADEDYSLAKKAKAPMAAKEKVAPVKTAAKKGKA
jgi:hypothetical protein